MKNAIIGSHGVGKSTLLHAIEPVRDGRIITEIARELIEEFGKTPQDMTQNERYKFQRDIYSRQFAKENYYKHFLSDRGVYDNLAYAKNTDTHLFNILRKDAKRNHPGYDNTFYIPIEFDLVNDGVRFTGDEFQKKVQDDILDILEDFRVPYLIIRGSVEERKEQVLHFISK